MESSARPDADDPRPGPLPEGGYDRRDLGMTTGGFHPAIPRSFPFRSVRRPEGSAPDRILDVGEALVGRFHAVVEPVLDDVGLLLDVIVAPGLARRVLVRIGA